MAHPCHGPSLCSIEDDQGEKHQVLVPVIPDGMGCPATGDYQIACFDQLVPVGFGDDPFAFEDPVVLGFIDMFVLADRAAGLDGELAEHAAMADIVLAHQLQYLDASGSTSHVFVDLRFHLGQFLDHRFLLGPKGRTTGGTGQ